MNKLLSKYKPYMSGLAFAIALIALVIMLAAL
jgi:hypothetical protein